MEALFTLGFIAIPLSIIATMIRIGMHAAHGFRNFREAQSTATITGSFIGDICTLILVPLLYMAITWSSDVVDLNLIVSFSGDQRYFWLVWILIYTAVYFYAINESNPLKPWGEVAVGLIIGSGVVINLAIAWPMLFADVVPLTLIGNFPIILALLLVFTRRQALLINNTQDQLDQRRYENEDVLDYLPDERSQINSYDYTGNAGQFLRQPLPVKMLAFIVGGGLLIAVTALLAAAFGMDLLVTEGT